MDNPDVSSSGRRAVTLCGCRLEAPGHVCAFFDSRAEEYDVLAPFYSEGLRSDEEVISVVGAERYADHCRRLEAHGIDVPKAIDDGMLHVLTADEWYMKELMEYESRANFLIQKYDATLLCVYDINEISGRMLMERLATHPYVIHGRTLRENPYYVPAVERLREVLLPDAPPQSGPSR